MARKVFYSFHFKRDAWRAAQVRNSNAIANEDEFGVIVDQTPFGEVEPDAQSTPPLGASESERSVIEAVLCLRSDDNAPVSDDHDVVESLSPVRVRLAATEEVQVRSVQDKHCCHNASSSISQP